MFDDVLCNHDLFGEHKGERHQTGDLNPLGGMFELYEITPSGRLEFLEYTIEDRSDPTAQGWAKLRGLMSTVYTGGRRDLNYHGWLYLSAFGRAKFTDGTMIAFEPNLAEPSEEGGSTGMPGHRHDPVAFVTAMRETMNLNQYLKDFFAELERLRPILAGLRPHALTCDAKGFYVLLALGDARVSLRFDEMDADPIRMAAAAIEKWRATQDAEIIVD